MLLQPNPILGLNFQRTFKISQDITYDNDLYLHIRNKIVTFSKQAKDTKNHISTQKSTQLKPKSFKQFEVKALKGLKGEAVYEIDYNARGIPKKVIFHIRHVHCQEKKHWHNTHQPIQGHSMDTSRTTPRNCSPGWRQKTIWGRSTRDHPPNES